VVAVKFIVGPDRGGMQLLPGDRQGVLSPVIRCGNQQESYCVCILDHQAVPRNPQSPSFRYDFQP
jgi:hypothetical protein